MLTAGDTVICKRDRRTVLKVIDPEHKSGLVECEVQNDARGSISNKFYRADDLAPVKGNT